MINVTTQSKKEEEAFDTLDQDWFLFVRTYEMRNLLRLQMMAFTSSS